MPRSRKCGCIRPLPHTPSRRSGYLVKQKDSFAFFYPLLSNNRKYEYMLKKISVCLLVLILMFVIEARWIDEGWEATLIIDLEMNEINDHKPRNFYLHMSLPIMISQRLGQLTLFEIKLKVTWAHVFKVSNEVGRKVSAVLNSITAFINFTAHMYFDFIFVDV
jgi:hypothetical protein